MSRSEASPLAPNIPLFIAFRVFFNARWYYPVLAVLFLDFGLSLEQYALLNVAWAISIVCLEVPSGALADQFGRRRVVILAASLMVVEMGLFAFAPLNSPWLFPMLLLNRLLSGAAEACASGADESLAYDSIPEKLRAAQWPSVLARLMRWQSAAFFAAMLTGAAIYDPKVVQTIADYLGFHLEVGKAGVMRWPLFLTLGNALVTLAIALNLREPPKAGPAQTPGVREMGRQIVSTGRWILHTQSVLFVILAGLCLDSVTRLFLTVCSNYYRLIGLPDASFGVIGAGFALLGFVVSPIGEALIAKRSIRTNFVIAAFLILAGLVVSARFLPKWGVLAVIPIGIGTSLLPLFLSFYLNQLVPDSSRRATLLSFKGLAFNLAYGGMGLLFAGFSRARAQAGSPDSVFMEAVRLMPWFFLASSGAVLALGWKSLKFARSPAQSIHDLSPKTD